MTERKAAIDRNTNETNISLTLDLDGSGQSTVETASGSSTTCSRISRSTVCATLWSGARATWMLTATTRWRIRHSSGPGIGEGCRR